MERINHRKCEIKGCSNKSYALFNTKFLCEEHYREKHPSKESNFRHGRKIGLPIDYWKEPPYML